MLLQGYSANLKWTSQTPWGDVHALRELSYSACPQPRVMLLSEDRLEDTRNAKFSLSTPLASLTKLTTLTFVLRLLLQVKIPF